MNRPSDAQSLRPSDRNERAGASQNDNSARNSPRSGLLLAFGFTVFFVAMMAVPKIRTNPHLVWLFCGTAAFFVLWQIALLFARRAKGLACEWEFVASPSHYVQASVQFSIYVYWGWYWRNVYAEAPLIVAQLAFVYIFDSLLTWTRGQKWRMGFGPWPIIFSTNLFMWFRDDWFVFQFLMIALGVLGKHFIRWKRDGKLTHIFNPSAFGLTVVSFILIFTGTSDYTWGKEIAITQGLPPHIYLEIFVGGLIVQYFFSVTLLTFSAAAVLAVLSLVYTKWTGVYLFIDSNIPIAVFLGLHLLMTDPATTPRSDFGRILFGTLYGAGVFGAYIIFEALKLPSFYDKLVLVPFLNLLAPALDRLASMGVAGRLGRWEAGIGLRKMNLTFMSCWALVFVVMLTTGFVEGPHPGATIGFWKKAAEQNRPHAAERLRTLLAKFNEEDLDDPSKPVGTIQAGVKQSREESLGILCNQVALIYAEGRFVPTNFTLAEHFFEKASQYGNLEGSVNLATYYLFYDKSASTPGFEHALDKLEKSGLGSNNAHALFLTGYSYETGRGHSMDKTKARQLYEKSASLGEVQAWRMAGTMEFLGEGGPVDYSAAAVWLQKAAARNDGPSCLYLAKLYHNGTGVPQDDARANELLHQACDLGVQPACELLEQQARKP